MLLRYSEDPLLFSRSDGSVEPTVGVDLLVGCNIDGVDALEDVLVELEVYAGETAEYSAAHDFLGMCDLSGRQVDPESMLESGVALPHWFGVGYLADHEVPETTDGIDAPAVWMDNERVLHGGFNRRAV